jgi:hypothetical protein
MQGNRGEKDQNQMRTYLEESEVQSENFVGRKLKKILSEAS